MRPRGEIRLALLAEARKAPGSVRELAQRAQVGFSAAAYTASRMLASEELQIAEPGRPAKLSAPAEQSAPAADAAREVFDLIHRSFWDRPAQGS